MLILLQVSIKTKDYGHKNYGTNRWRVTGEGQDVWWRGHLSLPFAGAAAPSVAATRNSPANIVMHATPRADITLG